MAGKAFKPTLSLLRNRLIATQFAPATASAIALGLTVPAFTKGADPSVIINADPDLTKSTRDRQLSAATRLESPPVAQEDGDAALIAAANKALAADRELGEVEDQLESRVIHDRYSDALQVLIKTPATSLSAGVRAKAQAVWNEMHGQTLTGGPFSACDLDRLTYSLAGDVIRLTAPPEGSLSSEGTDLTAATAQNTNPDAELIALGKEFARQDAFYQALLTNPDPAVNQEIDDQFIRVADIGRALEPLRARTLDGVMVKARAIAWIHQDEGVEDLPSQGGCTDERLAYSIVRDLLAAERVATTDPASGPAASDVVRDLVASETVSAVPDDDANEPAPGEPDADLIALCGLYLSAEKARCAADGFRDEVEVASWREPDPEKKAEILKNHEVLQKRYNEIAAIVDTLEDQVRRVRPTTLEGVKAVAKIADHYLDCWIDTPWDPGEWEFDLRGERITLAEHLPLIVLRGLLDATGLRRQGPLPQ